MQVSKAKIQLLPKLRLLYQIRGETTNNCREVLDESEARATGFSKKWPRSTFLLRGIREETLR